MYKKKTTLSFQRLDTLAETCIQLSTNDCFILKIENIANKY